MVLSPVSTDSNLCGEEAFLKNRCEKQSDVGTGTICACLRAEVMPAAEKREALRYRIEVSGSEVEVFWSDRETI